MNSRIKSVREYLEMNQEEFGSKINITKSAISLIEAGKRNLSSRTISDICREFDVNEDWLRTGEGEMLKPVEDDLDYMVAKYGDNLSPAMKAMVKALLVMDDESRKVFDEFIKDFDKYRKSEPD